jgi:hypothetical protein
VRQVDPNRFEPELPPLAPPEADGPSSERDADRAECTADNRRF